GGEAVLYELLEILVVKLSSEETKVPVAEKISSVVLFLMTKLREQQRLFSSPLLPLDPEESTAGGHSMDAASEVLARSYLPVDQLQTILRHLVTGLLRHSTSQLMRGNLFTALLNYLQFTRGSETSYSLSSDGKERDTRWMWYAQELQAQQQ